MSQAQRLRSQTDRIVTRYRVLLESAASPLIATADRWLQCRSQAESILFECADIISGRMPRMSTTIQRTAELGAQRALDNIPGKESVRAALHLWQAAEPIFREILLADPRQQDASRELATALNALAQALLWSLLHETVGYHDLDILRQVSVGGSGLHLSGSPCEDKPTVLTVRERQVLTCVAKAMTNYEVGRELGIAETTVKRHLRNIFEKLDATSRMEAIQKAGMSVELRTAACKHRSAPK